jgi:hypothetical protein
MLVAVGHKAHGFAERRLDQTEVMRLAVFSCARPITVAQQRA